MLSPYLVIFILMFLFFDNYFESSTIFITNVRGEHARVYICISYLLNSQSKSHQSVRRCVMVTCMIRTDGELVPFYYFLHDGSFRAEYSRSVERFRLIVFVNTNSKQDLWIYIFYEVSFFCCIWLSSFWLFLALRTSRLLGLPSFGLFWPLYFTWSGVYHLLVYHVSINGLQHYTTAPQIGV